MSNILIKNYSKNVSKVRNYTPQEVFNYLIDTRPGRPSRSTALKFTLISSIIGMLPTIKQHKRYL